MRQYDSADFEKKRLLITGGSGFIGQALIKELTDEYEIFAPAQEEMDITDFLVVKKYIERVKPNFIIHLAARTEVEKSFYDPTDFQLVNYNGTVNLIEASKDLNTLELFVFSSTMETSGSITLQARAKMYTGPISIILRVAKIRSRTRARTLVGVCKTVNLISVSKMAKSVTCITGMTLT